MMSTRRVAACLVALLLLRGVAEAAELPFVENGVLYRLQTDETGAQEAVASGVDRILDHKPAAQKMLYVASSAPQATGTVKGGRLMLVDTATWAEQLVADNVITAALSPDGATVALWNKNNEIHLVRSDGTPLRRIGVHGSTPLFSHDGSLIVYQKLADSSPDGASQSLFEHAQGIAVYDVQANRERLVTGGGMNDFAPVGFSQDMSRLYFNSTRPYDASPGNHVASVWVVDLRTGKTERLTNLDENAVRIGSVVPIIGEGALWSSDRTIVISSTGKERGVWMFALPKAGGQAIATHVADGDAPRWIVPDVSIAVRVVSNGRSMWRTFRVR